MHVLSMDTLPTELIDYIFLKSDFRTCLLNRRMYPARQLAKGITLSEHLACLKSSPHPMYFNWLYNCPDFCHHVLFRRLANTRMAYYLYRRCLANQCHTFRGDVIARTLGKYGTLDEIVEFVQHLGQNHIDDVLDGACMRRDAHDVFTLVPCTESGMLSVILSGNVPLLASLHAPPVSDFVASMGSVRAVESHNLSMISYVLDTLAFPKMSDMYIYAYGDPLMLRFLYLKNVPLPNASDIARRCAVPILQELYQYGLVLDEDCYSTCCDQYEKLVFFKKNFCPLPTTLFVQHFSNDPAIRQFFDDMPTHVVYTYFYWHDMIRATRREHVDEDRLIQFLMSDENDDDKIFFTVGKYAPLPLIDRLLKLGLTPEQRYEIARGTARLSVLRLLWPFRLEPALLTQSIIYERWDLFHWLLAQKCPIDELVHQEMAYKGDERLKKFLLQHEQEHKQEQDAS